MVEHPAARAQHWRLCGPSKLRLRGRSRRHGRRAAGITPIDASRQFIELATFPEPYLEARTFGSALRVAGQCDAVLSTPFRHVDMALCPAIRWSRLPPQYAPAHGQIVAPQEALDLATYLITSTVANPAASHCTKT